ncbi:MAG: SIR2 family protein [Deltaproteobacteria bacterium]|nr:SIR2 family protein [Deltaproteobacteria bacterium]
MTTRSKDIIFLLGAGASAEAGIPTSAQMIDKIEKLFASGKEWKPHLQLYHHVKSAIHYASGLKGRFTDVPFNIETLVNTLYELERNEDHPLYPFIAAWNSRLVVLAGKDFEQVRQLRGLILRELKKWMCPEDAHHAHYYSGLITLQRDLNYPLHVFSLNYDLLVEGLDSRNFRVETGFPGFGPTQVWDWERFEDSESSPTPIAEAFLYKLHGSINWKRDEAKNLYRVQQVENVEPEQMEVIFGRDFKLEAADPYLFYAYEFRKFTLSAKLIVTIGYGFGDAHINKMIIQSLRADRVRKLVVVARCADENARAERRRLIAERLECANDRVEQIDVRGDSASAFLGTDKLSELLLAAMPKEQDTPF